MVLNTLTLPTSGSTSSLDAPASVICTWFDPDERQPTLTVGGDYARELEADDDNDHERRGWAELAHRTLVRWAKENPF